MRSGGRPAAGAADSELPHDGMMTTLTLLRFLCSRSAENRAALRRWRVPALLRRAMYNYVDDPGVKVHVDHIFTELDKFN